MPIVVSIRVCTPSAELGAAVSARLGDLAGALEVADPGEFCLLGASAATAEAALARIAPLVPPLVPGVEGEAVLCLGDRAALETTNIAVVADTQELAEKLAAALHDLGLRRVRTRTMPVEQDEIIHSGAPLLVRQLIAWALAELRVDAPTERSGERGGKRVTVTARDPRFSMDIKRNAVIEIRADALSDARPVAEAMRALGFAQVTVRRRDPVSERGGVWGRGALARSVTACAEVEAALAGAGLLLERIDTDPDAPTLIVLPAPAARALRVSTDEPARAAALLAPLPLGRIDALPRPPLGAVLRYGKGSAPAAAAVRAGVTGALSALGASPLARLVEAPVLEEPAAEIRLDLPSSGIDAGAVSRRLQAAASRSRIRVCTASPALARAVEGALGPHPFGSFQICWAQRPEPRIRYGAAPELLIECLIDVIETRTGIRCERDLDWNEDIEDVTIELPDRAAQGAAARVDRALSRIRGALEGEPMDDRERRMAAVSRALSELAAEAGGQPLDVGAALDTLILGRSSPAEQARVRGLLLAAGIS